MTDDLADDLADDAPTDDAVRAAMPLDRRDGPHSWREVGSGAPVVFLHGLGGSRLSWEPQLRDLGNSFRCIAWDMPGYGHAEPLTPLTYEGIATRLVELLDHLGIERADLVGLSFGGMHALRTSLAYPDRVGQMVLVDSSPAFGMDGTTRDDWTRARLDPLDRGETPSSIANTVIDSITATPLTGIARDELLAGFREISVAGFRASVECLPDNDVRDRLHEIAHRCCVIVGELDEETPVAYARVLADGLRDAELHVLDGVGHLTPSEAPTRFNDIVTAFLGQPSDGPIDHPEMTTRP